MCKAVLAMLLTKRARALVNAESESARQYTLSSRTSGTTHTCRHNHAAYTPLIYHTCQRFNITQLSHLMGHCQGSERVS